MFLPLMLYVFFGLITKFNVYNSIRYYIILLSFLSNKNHSTLFSYVSNKIHSSCFFLVFSTTT